MTLDVQFRGLDRPLRLTGAGALLPILAEVAPGWPHRAGPADPLARPFFSITAEAGAYRCETLVEDRPERRLDAVNAVCDAVAGLAMALPAEDDRLLCLHAAGVVMAGRVVVFPNIRRAGKSTLSAALARAGHRVFSDDVLPVTFAAGGMRAQSMGIAPRLRLPLPGTLPQGFRAWAASVAGPENAQYRYLRLPDPPMQGESLAVGAFVILDRQEVPAPARLAPVPPDQAMDALLHQNFTRDRHSGDILAALAAVLPGLPVLRLTYADLDDAVSCLSAAFAEQGSPAAADGAALRFRMADLDPAPARPDPEAALCQRPGTTVRTIGAGLYLADAEGRAIHRIDPLAAAIWELLETPARPQEIAALLVEAFPETDPARLSADVAALLASLTGAGLLA